MKTFGLRAPADNERGPVYAEKVFAALHQMNPENRPVRFMLSQFEGQTGLFVQAPGSLEMGLRYQWQSHYPDSEQFNVSDLHLRSSKEESSVSATVTLASTILPLLSFVDNADSIQREYSDPLAGVFGALVSTPQNRLRAAIVFDVHPAGQSARRQAQTAIECLKSQHLQRHTNLRDCIIAGLLHRRRFVRWTTWLLRHAFLRSNSDSAAVSLATQKVEAPLFSVQCRILVYSKRDCRAQAAIKINQVFGALAQYNHSDGARFKLRSGTRKLSSLFTASELASIIRPPLSDVKTPRRMIAIFRQLEPPLKLPSPKDPDVTTVGRVYHADRCELFGIRGEDRLRHMVVVGKTGMGKSSLLQRMFIEDMRKGNGVGIIDPHGDLFDNVSRFIPQNRRRDVDWFDATNPTRLPAYNPLEVRDATSKHLVAEELVAALQTIFGIDETSAPRMLYVLRNALMALLDAPSATLLDLQEMLCNAHRRREVLQHCSDQMVRRFWLEEFEPLQDKIKREWVAPIQNKVGTFLASPQTRRILCPKKTSIDLRKTMDDGKILLVNLAKGKLGESSSRLIGTLLVAGIQAAAMSRASLDKAQRSNFYLTIDEFQNFTSRSFESIFSEARKYGLGLTVAHQYLGQPEEGIRQAIFGNAGTYVAFQVGSDDAETLGQYFGGRMVPEDLSRLPRYTAYVKTQFDGLPSGPFSMKTLPPIVR